MKSVYNSLKQPVTNYLKKEISKEGGKEIEVLTQKLKSLDVKDNININSNIEPNQKQIFTYKPSIIQQKLNNNFDYTNRFKLNDSNQSKNKKVGLSNVLYQQFSTKVNKMERYADPTNDVAFKKIFNESNKEGLKNFIESIVVNAKDYPFSSRLESVEFLNKDQMPSLMQGKRSLCDLKVKDDKGNTYIIEMQKRNEKDYLQRVQYYSAHAVVDQIEQGQSHSKIDPIITISIMGKKCFEDDVPCISYHPNIETVTNKQLLNMQSHIFIELPKVDGSKLKEDTLEWLNMFKQAPTITQLPSVSNDHVLKAYETLEQHKWTKEESDAYIDAKIFDDMEKSNIEHAKNEGEHKGKNKKAIEIAKNMIKNNETIEKISQYTGLSIDDIKKL
jgi:predicted transposase/invertase (TIGR01784 family)